MSGRARGLFDSIFVEFKNDEDRTARIRQIMRSEPEWEVLDFKNGNALAPKGKGSRRFIWAESLSAFANSDGGILIWGVDCRATNGEAEEATEALVPDVESFRADLHREYLDATEERVLGVEIEFVKVNNDAGFVICYIPSGNHKPYRACGRGLDRYFIRAGDSNVSMSHSMLKSMFFPNRQMRICVEVQPYELGADGSSVVPPFRVSLSIRNRGNSTLDALTLRITSDPQLRTVALGNQWRMERHDNKTHVIHRLSPIHPELATESIGIDYSARDTHVDSLLSTIRVAAFARDMEPAEAEIRVAEHELVGRTRKSISLSPIV